MAGQVSEEARTELSNRQSSVSASEKKQGLGPVQPPPAHLGLAGGVSFSPSLFAALRSRWTRFLGKELGPPPSGVEP